MAFETFDLGRVLATAEGIKSAQRQSTMDALRERYLNTQISGAEQAQQLAVNQDQRAQQTADQQQAQFTDEQRLKNLQLVGVASADIAGDPARVSQWLPVLQKAGVLDPNFDPSQHSPQELQQIATNLATRSKVVQDAFLKQNPQMAAIAAEHQNRLEQIRTEISGRQNLAGQEHGYKMDEIAATGDQARQTAQVSGGQRDFRNEMQLRKEFEGLQAVKDYKTVIPIYERARTAPNTRAGDLSVVYALGKAFDPNSVVREGEMTLSKDAQPWLAKLVGEAQSQVKRTGALDPTTRKEILAAIKGQVDALGQNYQYERSRYADYAQRGGFTVDGVVGSDYGPQNSQPAPGGADFSYVPGKGLIPNAGR